MYHYAEGDEQRGPVEREALRGRIRPDTLVWREGMADWKPALELEELRDLFAINTAPAQPVVTAQPIVAETVATGEASPVGSNVMSPVIGYQSAGSIATPPGLAVASMVMGIISVPFLCAWPLSLVCAVLALVFGFVSRAQCARENRAGAGMALAGIILGFVPIGLVLVIALIAIIAALAGI